MTTRVGAPFLVLAAVLLLAAAAAVQPAAAQTAGKCANSQPYFAANNTCLCNKVVFFHIKFPFDLWMGVRFPDGRLSATKWRLGGEQDKQQEWMVRITHFM